MKQTKPDPKKEYMEKISGTESVYVDGINVGTKSKIDVKTIREDIDKYKFNPAVELTPAEKATKMYNFKLSVFKLAEKFNIEYKEVHIEKEKVSKT